MENYGYRTDKKMIFAFDYLQCNKKVKKDKSSSESYSDLHHLMYYKEKCKVNDNANIRGWRNLIYSIET